MNTGIERTGKGGCVGRCSSLVGPDMTRVMKSLRRDDLRCRREAIYLVDGEPLCRIHAALVVLDALTGESDATCNVD